MTPSVGWRPTHQLAGGRSRKENGIWAIILAERVERYSLVTSLIGNRPHRPQFTGDRKSATPGRIGLSCQTPNECLILAVTC